MEPDDKRSGFEVDREEAGKMKSFFEAVMLCLLVLFLVVVVPGFFTVYLILGWLASRKAVTKGLVFLPTLAVWWDRSRCFPGSYAA
jgi:hypothetical protein